MKILHAASELYPLVSTGGLSSVVRALPDSLNRRKDVRSAVVIPFYGELEGKVPDIQWLPSGRTHLEEEFGLGFADVSGLPVFFIARDEFFGREGVYGPSAGESWADNADRFSFFSRAVASSDFLECFQPDLIHCHDWQAALIPVYLRYGPTPTVLTIHNLQFQGRFHRAGFAATGLPDTLFTMDALEFWGDLNFLKGGIVFADQVTTVSPGYAREILTPGFGCALDGVLREYSGKLTGILNGIDTETWNPECDLEIPAVYTTGNMRGKSLCRAALIREMGLATGEDDMLLGMVTRLTIQKGIDIVLDSAGTIIGNGCSLVILGTGDKWAEDALVDASKRFPGKIAVRIDYNDHLARMIFSGSDGFLMPSQFEPCGLGQMMAMRYGSIPLVSSVGGLADTVNRERGFSFKGGVDSFKEALGEMICARGNRRKWAWYIRRCMSTDFSWAGRLEGYMEVYRKALERK